MIRIICCLQNMPHHRWDKAPVPSCRILFLSYHLSAHTRAIKRHTITKNLIFPKLEPACPYLKPGIDSIKIRLKAQFGVILCLSQNRNLIYLGIVLFQQESLGTAWKTLAKTVWVQCLDTITKSSGLYQKLQSSIKVPGGKKPLPKTIT